MTERTEHSWAVDSISEGTARVEEDGQRMLSIPTHLLPAGVTEGQLLRVSRSSHTGLVVTIAIDHAGAAAALRVSKATTTAAMENSKKHDAGGDVAL